MIDSKYISKIEEVFTPKYYTVYKMYDAVHSYLFAIKRKDNKESTTIDPFYIINKKTLKIEGFLPHMQWDIFELAVKCPVEWR